MKTKNTELQEDNKTIEMGKKMFGNYKGTTVVENGVVVSKTQVK